MGLEFVGGLGHCKGQGSMEEGTHQMEAWGGTK